jgi:hypothetical protein
LGEGLDRAALRVPGLTVHSGFVTLDHPKHLDPEFGASRFAGERCDAFGASTATTANWARSFATRSAVLPSIHPSWEKPIIEIAIAPAMAPQTASATLGYLFMKCASRNERP